MQPGWIWFAAWEEGKQLYCPEKKWAQPGALYMARLLWPWAGYSNGE